MTIAAPDGTGLHVVDWGGAGRPVVLLHAWGLNGHMWNAQVQALLDGGLRCITLDRRGHGLSERATSGCDLDTLAGDVGAVLDTLDVVDGVLVGHSMGGLEAAHVVGGPGTARIGALVLSAPVTPCLAAGVDNALGVPVEMLRANRAAMAADIGGWIGANTDGYWGTGPDRWPLDTAWTQATLHGTPLPVLLATNDVITTADVRRELATIECPTLVIQGDADRSAPLDITGRPTAALIRGARLDVIEGAGHGLYVSFAAAYNERLVEFITSG